MRELRGSKAITKRNEEDMKDWIKAAGTRAIKTVAQTAVASIGASAVLSDVSWPVVVSASVLAGILSLLTSIAGIPEVDDGDSLAAIERAKHAKQ